MDTSRFGLALDCFADGVDNRLVLVCLDEEGVRYEYKGPSNPNSTTTLFGRWTGPGAFCDDVPAKVVGRNGRETSALDSFSMLYAIQCYELGHHNQTINVQYINRIGTALERGVISSFKDMAEFKAASRILDSFQRTGHLFDILTKEAELMYASSEGAVHPENKWIEHDASLSYPLFEFSETEMEALARGFEQNPNAKVTNLHELIEWLKTCGMESSYPFVWMQNRVFQYEQALFAADHMLEQLKHVERNSRFLPSWLALSKKSFVKARSAVTIESIAHDITANIIQTLI